MQSLLLAGLSASNECGKSVVELILVSGHQPVGRALARNERSLPKGEGSSCGRRWWAGCSLAAYFAFRKSPTSSSTNSLSSALLVLQLEENGRLLSLPTMICVSSTRSTFSMVKNGNVSTPSLSGLRALLSGSLIFIRSI